MSDQYKILIVDDDSFLLNMYSIKFKKEGYDVTSVTNPEEALKKIEAGLKPDVFIFDIIMPGMNGVDLLKEVKNKGYNNDSVFVMLTNESDSEQIEEAKSLGIDGYIVKATATPSEVVEEVLRITNEKLN